jgi:hypothetical protein
MWDETVLPACVLPVEKGLTNATGRPNAVTLFDPYLESAPPKYERRPSSISAGQAAPNVSLTVATSVVIFHRRARGV